MPERCAYCGRVEGHSPRCSVTKFGVAEARWDGGDESRVQALMAENKRLRETLIAARDLFTRMEMPSYATACDKALDA